MILTGCGTGKTGAAMGPDIVCDDCEETEGCGGGG